MKKNAIETKKIDCVVLKIAHSGDFNAVYTILTSENKKISLYASNIRHNSKKLATPEVFDICTFEIAESEENLSKLKDYKFISNFKNLRENFTKLCASTTLLEATNNLLRENDSTPFIFSLICSALSAIDKEKESLKIFKTLYDTLFSLLIKLGYENELFKKPASKNNLLNILNKVENISEIGLKSKDALILTLPQSKCSH